MNDSTVKKYLPLAVAVIIILLYLVPLGSYHLLEPDEGRYAEIPREMLESGNFITPMLNYIKYFEKPAMLYWMNAASFHVFGETAFAARFASAVCGLLGILVTGLLAGHIFGRTAGIVSATVTATSTLYFTISSINLTDMPLTFFLTLAMAAFYAGHTKRDRRWYLLFYAAMALGTLTKGLVAIVLPGGIIFWYIIFTRKWRLFLEALYAPGILFFFAIVTPWFYLVCRDNSDFFRFFFIQEHFLRYTTKMHGRYEPFWFFLPLIPAAVMPWTGFLLALFGKESVVRSPEKPVNRDANIFLLLWFGVILLFFSLSDSKLIPYIAPCVPPLAILMGADIHRMYERRHWHGGALWWTLGISVLFSAALLVYSFIGDRVAFADSFPIAVKVSAGLLAGPLVALWTTKAKRLSPGRTLAVLCVSAMLYIAGTQDIFKILDRSTYDVSQVIINERQDGDTIAVYGEVLQGIPFYTRQRVMLVDYYGELEFGGKQSGGKGWFLTGNEFLREWGGGARSFVLVAEKERIDNLFLGKDAGEDRRLESGKYVVLIKRKADRQ